MYLSEGLQIIVSLFSCYDDCINRENFIFSLLENTIMERQLEAAVDIGWRKISFADM